MYWNDYIQDSESYINTISIAMVEFRSQYNSSLEANAYGNNRTIYMREKTIYRLT